MIQYPYIMFDWGDTIMKDDPSLDIPMVQWPQVEAIEGAEEVLRALHVDRTIVMATSADRSGEAEIRAALRRVNLADYFDHIFCYRNTGLQKSSSDFYRYILEALKIEPTDILMVGDHFKKDVQLANSVGITAVWLNRRDSEDRQGLRHQTIHRLSDLLLLIKTAE
jgi:FMN phosphatase YigB (HAD superfamily)